MRFFTLLFSHQKKLGIFDELRLFKVQYNINSLTSLGFWKWYQRNKSRLPTVFFTCRDHNTYLHVYYVHGFVCTALYYMNGEVRSIPHTFDIIIKRRCLILIANAQLSQFEFYLNLYLWGKKESLHTNNILFSILWLNLFKRLSFIFFVLFV